MKLIHRSKEDRDLLEEIDLLSVIPSKLNGYDFSNTAVKKPWGYEYLVYENDDQSLCAWALHMNNNGAETSLHCHRSKRTKIMVLEGEARIKTIKAELNAGKDDVVLIDQATFHSLKSLSDPCVIVEIESPSRKIDAVRSFDHWGRERQEYEAQCELVHIDALSCPYKKDPALLSSISSIARESIELLDPDLFKAGTNTVLGL